MSVTTKGGDKGTSALFSGERLAKDDVRFEALGTGDELVCHLGELRLVLPEYGGLLLGIQKNIFMINSHCADTSGEKFIPGESEITILESFIQQGEAGLNLKGFIIPSENLMAAKADICRTVCRRFERRLISLSACANLNPVVLKYVNRLSDFLFIMARLAGKEK